MTEANRNEKLYIQAFREIRSYIMKNHLKPGDLLPTEQQLCAQFGVSRNVLREAIKGEILLVKTSEGGSKEVSDGDILKMIQKLIKQRKESAEQFTAAGRQELADNTYPIKSFFDAGANVVFHSDYPVSPLMDIKLSIYMAEKRMIPEVIMSGSAPRNTKEAITREQSLRAMTINVARQLRQEHRMGTIEFGKLANMSVYDCDFLHDDLEKVLQANLIATIVDGEEVYKA